MCVCIFKCLCLDTVCPYEYVEFATGDIPPPQSTEISINKALLQYFSCNFLPAMHHRKEKKKKKNTQPNFGKAVDVNSMVTGNRKYFLTLYWKQGFV